MSLQIILDTFVCTNETRIMDSSTASRLSLVLGCSHKGFVMSLSVLASAGFWLAHKARRNADDVGTFQAARNLRKQGVPLNLALALLLARRG